MSLIQVARYSDVKYDFKDGFARVPVLENAFDQACFAHCALQPGHSITPDVYSVTEHNQLFFFTKGKGYITTPRQAWNINEPGVFVPEFDTERFTITTASGQSCQSSAGRDVTMTVQQGVPYAVVTLDYTCASDASAHEVTATLFPDDEGYVRDTETIVTYELDGQSGSAALNAQQPLFSTEQSAGHRFVQFFTLGAEHLLTGIDHILFLLALIAGSRRLREVILAASAFTLAHSVTFILATGKSPKTVCTV